MRLLACLETASLCLAKGTVEGSWELEDEKDRGGDMIFSSKYWSSCCRKKDPDLVGKQGFTNEAWIGCEDTSHSGQIVVERMKPAYLSIGTNHNEHQSKLDSRDFAGLNG